jgi:hypothetical protein
MLAPFVQYRSMRSRDEPTSETQEDTMRKRKTDGIAAVVREVEKLAKQIRADIRKRATAAGLPKTLTAAAAQLRKRAAVAAAQVEKYVHTVRTDLERGNKGPAKRSKPKHRPAAPAAQHL